MRRLVVPHTYVLLFLIVIVVAIGTYVVPAGVFDRFKDEATGLSLIHIFKKGWERWPFLSSLTSINPSVA